MGNLKVPVNLDNYPALKELAGENREEFLQLMKAMFTIANEAVSEGHDKTSQKFFGIPIQDLLAQLLEAMFDHRGIIGHLPNQSNADVLSDMYKHALNPLHAAFTKENMLNSKGDPVSFEEKFGMEDKEFSVKKWIQGLMFYSYYCSLPDLASYLALDEYALMEEEKHENIAKLIELRPVLDYQKRIGIIPGKLIPETGFFQAGDLFENTEICPACRSVDKLIEVSDDLTVCIECKAGYER